MIGVYPCWLGLYWKFCVGRGCCTKITDGSVGSTNAAPALELSKPSPADRASFSDRLAARCSV